MQDHLEVRMLGEFSIGYRGRFISDRNSRSRKLWTLLEYLVTFRGRVVSQTELIELLWPEGAEIENPANTLKTILYRVRALLDELGYGDRKQIIIYSRGTYLFNPEIPMDVDADNFAEFCRKGNGNDTPDGKKIELLTKAAEIYKGDFLPKSAHESWAVPIGTYYHSTYIKAALKLCGLLVAESRWQEILEIAQRAAGIDAYTESFHQYLIRALVETGQPQAALAHYDYVTNLFYTQLGINPSQELASLYKLVRQASNEPELDLNIIKNTLGEREGKSGAFFCEYGLFREVYRIEARASLRSGQSVCIALLTVTDLSGGKPSQKILNNAMSMLSECIRCSLRRGDVYTRYSVSQYLVMLSSVSFETGTAVAGRIIRRFKNDHPKSPVRIGCKLQPIDPILK